MEEKFKVAQLDTSEVDKINKMQDQFKQDTGKNIVLVAYQEENK